MDKILSCESTKLLLSAYFDNELNAEESLKIKKHINNCEECNQELHYLEKLSHLLKDYSERIELDCLDLSQKVINKLCKEEKLFCSQVQKEAKSYLSGNVDIDLYYSITEHINNCSDCKSAYNQFKS